MFDIGFSELLVIAVVALLVLGPERLPKAARFAGLWVRKARAQWYSVKSEFERDLAADELQRSLRETRESLRQAEEQLRGNADSIKHQIERGFDDVAAAAAASVETDSAGTAAPMDLDADGNPVRPANTEPERDPYEDEEMRPLGSSLEMEALEPPPPLDEDEDEGTVTHAAPPPQTDDDRHERR